MLGYIVIDVTLRKKTFGCSSYRKIFVFIVTASSDFFGGICTAERSEGIFTFPLFFFPGTRNVPFNSKKIMKHPIRGVLFERWATDGFTMWIGVLQVLRKHFYAALLTRFCYGFLPGGFVKKILLSRYVSIHQFQAFTFAYMIFFDSYSPKKNLSLCFGIAFM